MLLVFGPAPHLLILLNYKTGQRHIIGRTKQILSGIGPTTDKKFKHDLSLYKNSSLVPQNEAIFKNYYSPKQQMHLLFTNLSTYFHTRLSI